MKRKISLLFAVAAFAFCLLLAFSASAEEECNYFVSLSRTSYSYTGSIQRPRVYVRDAAGNDLPSDQYTVVYHNFTSTELGEYSITVTGNGDLTGTTEAFYKIVPRHIKDGTVISLEYLRASSTGKEICPDATVTYNGTELEKGVDYTLAYRDNIMAGNAHVDVIGLGNYSGKTVKGFTIVPGPVTNLRCTEKTVSSIKLNWNRNPNADGYIIYKYSNGKYHYVKTIEGGKYMGHTLYLPSGQNYKFAVKAYKDFNNTRYYSDISKIVSAYTLVAKYNSGIVIRRSDNSSTGQVLFHSVSGCSGYQLMYSNDPTFKTGNKTATNIGSGQIGFNVSGLNKSLPIYARIRVFLDTPDGRIYGAWSNSENDFDYDGKVWLNKDTFSTSMRISYEKSVYGTGYQVFYSLTYGFKSGTKSFYVNGINNLNKTVSNLARNKGYFVKVRPFYKIGSTCYYGPFSYTHHTGYKYIFESYSSKYVNNANRTTNLRIASNAIDGIVIQPGETFDFNKIVGPRTAERGYKKATVFTGSKGTAQELGGGICQVASTLFNTCLYADVKITERYQHSQKVSYVPMGRDAAISGASKNFRWTNNYGFPIRVYMTVSGGVITCSFYTQSDEDHGNVQLKVTQKGNTYTLRRYHNGSVDYTCTSKF